MSENKYTLFYEDERGALFFDEQAGPYAVYAARDGGVAFVDVDGEDLRDLVSGRAPKRPVGPRAARRAQRRSKRRSATAAGVAAVSTMALLLGPGVVPANGAEPPVKLLQAVDIELGADGALTRITSTGVRDTDGERSTKKAELDPGKVAGDLPVRVLTSYVHDGRTGTNLADLKGAKGRVQVTITVQNTTVHAERVAYDVGGVPQERFALIGTPLTVTASAVLPKDARVVLPEHNVEQASTNGVVGRTESGDTTVQWAAMLAPPRLSASASFTLVEDAADFRMPELDIAVQPGLVTDPSVERLVREAFRKDGTSQVSLQSKAIVLIGTVNGVLGDATRTLDEIRRALSDGADTIGSRLIGQLAASSTQLTHAAGDLSASLDQLDAGLAASLEQSRDDNVASLRRTVETLSEYIGHPDDEPVEPLPVKPGCTISVAGAKKATTLYGQLKRVSQQLLTLKSATQGCTDEIKASVSAELGNPDDCPPAATSVACTLVSARGRLTDVATYLATAGKALVDQFDPTAVDGVRAALDSMTKKVVDVQNAAKKLGTPSAGNDADELGTDLAALSDDLDALLAGLQPGGGGLAAALESLHDGAAARQAAIGGTNGSAASISGQLAAAAAAVCDTPAALLPNDADATAYVDQLRAILVGTSCGNGANATPLPVPAGYTAPLSARLQVEYEAWATVAALTDLDAAQPAGAAKETRLLAAALTDVRDAVDDLAASVGGGSENSLKNKLGDLQQKVDALYAAPTEAGTCVPPAATALPALNALATAFSVLDCNQKGLGANLSALLATATPTYEDAAATVGAAAARTNQARLDTASALDDLLGTLNGSLADAADRSLGEGGAVIEDQQRLLTANQDSAVADLDAATRAAIGDISESIAGSNRLLGESTDLLERGLRSVQLDLGQGGRSPSGLLGVVTSSATRTAAAGARVGEASGDAAAFRSVRSAELDDVLLQQAQLTRALELEAVFPPFATTLPPGSTSSVVFSFHLRGV